MTWPTFLVLLPLVFSLTSCALFHHDPIADSNGKLITAPSGTANLWILLGKDLKMNHYTDQPDVKTRIAWYMQNTAYLEKVANRASPYVYFVLQEVKLRKMPSEIALLPIVESSYDPYAYSVSGAAGLWQMMPGTASGFSVRQNWWYDGRRDVYASTIAALDYLEYLHTYFDGDWYLALAAYNCGQGAVANAMKLNEAAGKKTDFWSLDLRPETRQYVPKLLALSAILADPSKYPVAWPQTDMQPFIAIVPVGNQIDLDTAAKLADISPEELRQLNPGFNQWATDPDGTHELILPVNKVSDFERNLAAMPKNEQVTWQRYTVKSGDNIDKIAHKYKTSPKLIAQINSLKANAVRVGQILIIPIEAKAFSKEQLNTIQHYLNHKVKLPGPELVNYTVKRSDTFASIAKKYNVTPQAIVYWNQIPRGQGLYAGQELILWTKAKTASYDSVRLRPYTVNYKVQEGENLTDIAKQFNVSVKQIKQANHLTSNSVKVGQKLIIPPTVQTLAKVRKRPQTYEVKAGDTLSSIAKKFNVTIAQLKSVNHLANNNIKLKQVLHIPTKGG